MPDTATIPLSALWDETIAFLRAEAALVLPLACLGFALPMIIMMLAVPTDALNGGKLAAGPWMLWFVPSGLLSIMGSLGVSALALHPGASVRECLRVVIARLPSAIGLVVFNVAAQIVLALPVTAITLAETGATGAPGAFSSVANLAVIAATIWLFVRVLPIWALLAHRPLTPLGAIRGVFALTRGHYRKLLLLRVFAVLAGLMTLLAVLVPTGVMFVAFGRVTGAQDVAQTLSFVATGMAVAALISVWTVYVARVYVRLAGSSNGI